ncbi:alpha/beta hydrolase [Streptomyces sp. NPDC018031]|uniref:alpha/beta hydrolase n=1 Tax=Streptomyces sp. NPDC018031 TaxID=3365033 RepID=UPI0037BC9897
MPVSSGRHRRPRARRAAVAATAATVLLAAAGAAAGPAALGAPAPPLVRSADDEARIVSATRLDERTVDLAVDSPAVGGTVPVRVILPAGFDARPDRTWPVLYLLQGGHDDHTSWTRETAVEEFLADKEVIAVLPSAGPTGIPTRWRHGGDAAAPDYERFQVDEVMGLLRRHFRASATRAVAGVSTGGYGAMAFAARRPGAFAAAASYSGILDTTAPGMPTVVGAIVAREGLRPTALWGSPVLDRDVWLRHNPASRVERLAGTRLYVSQGGGVPGVDFGNLEGAVLEGTLRGQAQGFVRRLERAGVPVRTHFYSGGSHGWRYWEREFEASWPTLAAGLGLPA